MSPASYRAAPPRVGGELPYVSSEAKPNRTPSGRLRRASCAWWDQQVGSIHVGNEFAGIRVFDTGQLHQVGHHGPSLGQDHDG
jgi:hypothetical protein